MGKYWVRKDMTGYPVAIELNNWTIIHLDQSDRTKENIERIVAMLNEHEAMRRRIEELESNSDAQDAALAEINAGIHGECPECYKMRNEIARMRELVKASYDEGYLAACGERGNIVSNWNHSHAKAALDGEGK